MKYFYQNFQLFAYFKELFITTKFLTCTAFDLDYRNKIEFDDDINQLSKHYIEINDYDGMVNNTVLVEFFEKNYVPGGSRDIFVD